MTSQGPPAKRCKVLSTQFDQLAAFTTLVADTGEIKAIAKYKPEDATTNPSLLYKVATLADYEYLVNGPVNYGRDLGVDVIMDKLAVQFGLEILKHVPGYVSTEVDARLSFNTEATVAKARKIMAMYEEVGVSRSRILIKIASTWEGIRACEILQKEGINCNMTLLFSLAQAAACAEAGAILISPFVGRILDFYKKKTGRASYPAAEDPGCVSVTEIYSYYKKFGYKTIVMGASFRNKEEILQLAGCDRLTISPKLLEELKQSTELVERRLDASTASLFTGDKVPTDESSFRLMMNNDAMATSKLAEGIRGFIADSEKLEAIIYQKLGVPPSDTALLNDVGHVEDEFAQMARMTTLVADTGDIEAIKKFQPTDATTNPSLIFKASQMPRYSYLVDDAIAHGVGLPMGASEDDRVAAAMDKLSVNFGLEILKIVPGYVSTEVDARLSYDTAATLDKAHKIIELYKAAGVDKSRILIKIASTWEGIRACEILQKEGITCNMTLLFALTQAVACAEAGATLISPFVGRILDWHKKNSGRDSYPAAEDPGCISVSDIYGYYKKFGYKTIVMGASFRNKEEILQLAGCDRLTIAPALLEELKNGSGTVERKLEPASAAAAYHGPRLKTDIKSFRLALNNDGMATEKLAEGISGFSADIVKVENVVRARITASLQ